MTTTGFCAMESSYRRKKMKRDATIRFGIYTLLAGSLFVYALMQKGPRLSQPLWLLAGTVVWGALEYAFHRWLFHSSKVGHWAERVFAYEHSRHHLDPLVAKHLFLPLKLTLPISSAILIAVIGLLGIAAAAPFYLGLLLGYALYEWLHYRAHHDYSEMTGLTAWLKRYHLAHHCGDESKHFGVSSPLFDWLARTM